MSGGIPGHKGGERAAAAEKRPERLQFILQCMGHPSAGVSRATTVLPQENIARSTPGTDADREGATDHGQSIYHTVFICSLRTQLQAV